MESVQIVMEHVAQGGDDMPVQLVRKAADRYASLKGNDKRDRRFVDQRAIGACATYGDRKVNAIVKEALKLRMSQSIFDYSQFAEQLSQFQKQETVRNLIGLEAYERAKDEVCKELRKTCGTLHPLSITTTEELVNHLPKVKASAGFLGMLTGKSKKGDNLEEILESMNWKMEHLEAVDYSPIVFGTRTNIRRVCGDGDGLNPNWDTKTRAIHIVSAEDVAIEMLTAQPFMEAFKHVRWYAGGKDNLELTSQIWRMRYDGCQWDSIDYSAYDSTIPSWLIRDCFNIIFSLFEGLPKGYEQFIIRGFTYTRMMVEGGRVVRKTHGVPSGSYFTQAIDSLANAIMIRTYLNHIKGPDLKCIIMGDDNLIFTPHGLDLNGLAYYLKTRFGVVMNPLKCDSGNSLDDPHFLSRLWTGHGARRDLREVIVKLICPERERNYSQRGMCSELLIRALFDVYPVTIRRHFDLDAIERVLQNRFYSMGARDLILEDLPGAVYYKLVYLDGYQGLNLTRVADSGTLEAGES